MMKQYMIGKCRGLLGRVNRRRQELAHLMGRMPSSMNFENREGHTDYNFALPFRNVKKGVSAMLRVKNEASKIDYVLASIYDLFNEIVIVDNNSDDDTVSIVKRFAATHDASNKIKLSQYPFQIARYGPESEQTPGNSVHSSSYFYNYCSSLCSYEFICKWDGDMIVIADARKRLRERLKQLNPRFCYMPRGLTLYRMSDGRFVLTDEMNYEVRFAPLSYRYVFMSVNQMEWWSVGKKLPSRPILNEAVFYELKFIDENEFAHWSTTEFPTDRKRKEWANYQKLRRSEIDDASQVFPSGYLATQIPEKYKAAIELPQ